MYSIKLNDDDMVGMWANLPPDLDGFQGCLRVVIRMPYSSAGASER